MRVCTRCRVEKDEEQFDVIQASTGKRSSWCKGCRSAHAKASYAERDSFRRMSIENSKVVRRNANIAYVREMISDWVCQKCGVSDTRRCRIPPEEWAILDALVRQGGEGSVSPFGYLLENGLIRRTNPSAKRIANYKFAITPLGEKVHKKRTWKEPSNLRFIRTTEGAPSVSYLAKNGYRTEVIAEAIKDSTVFCKACTTNIYLGREKPQSVLACEAAAI